MNTINVTELIVVVGYHVEGVSILSHIDQLEKILKDKEFIQQSKDDFLTTYVHKDYVNHNKKTLVMHDAVGNIHKIDFLEPL